MSPRMMMIAQVYEAALDAGDQMVIAACRRLRTAYLRGWKRHHDPADLALVREFDDMLAEARMEDRLCDARAE